MVHTGVEAERSISRVHRVSSCLLEKPKSIRSAASKSIWSVWVPAPSYITMAVLPALSSLSTAT